MAEWYRWNTQQEAQDALDAINGNGRFPVTCRNAQTQEPAPDKGKTLVWASAVIACLDGKFGFLRIPKLLLAEQSVPLSESQAFLDTYQPTIEEFDPAWLPEAEL